MNKLFKIGIITMHRVRNNGSVLQAYALQTKVKDLGFDSDIIDYLFPNKEHKKTKQNFLFKYIKHLKYLLIEVLFGFPNHIHQRRINKFYKSHLRLSARSYLTKEELDKNPPFYNLLITGSDQVWNPNHIGEDTSFMLSFCKDKNVSRISYSSSFASNIIPEKLQSLYSKYLSKYNVISVRESSGVKIIKDLIQVEATVACDPTLLLDKLEWLKIANSSKIKIRQPYILAYILTYAYNPYPQIDELIRKLQNQLGIHVVFLKGKFSDYKFRNSTIIKNAGPNEFVRLFLDAQYVITTSFHGTAFALNFSKPFTSVVNNNADNDSRMLSLLNLAGAVNRAIPIDSKELTLKPMDYDNINRNIQELRNQSTSYLFNSIKDNLH